MPGFASPSGSKPDAEQLHRREIALAEELRHRARLVDADAVLAGERAARVDAGVEDRRRELLGALGLALDRLVVEHERVQVPVAGVEDARDPQPVLGAELGGPPQHLGQLRSRHDAVLDVVARRDPAHRGERRLAAAPDPRALLRRLGRVQLERAEPRQISSTAADSSATCDGRPVELDDQHRAGARRVAGVRPRPRPPRS